MKRHVSQAWPLASAGTSMGNTFESHPCFHTSGYQRRPNPPRAKRRRSLESWRASHSTTPGRTIIERHSMSRFRVGLIGVQLQHATVPPSAMCNPPVSHAELSRDGHSI